MGGGKSQKRLNLVQSDNLSMIQQFEQPSLGKDAGQVEVNAAFPTFALCGSCHGFLGLALHLLHNCLDACKLPAPSGEVQKQIHHHPYLSPSSLSLSH